jgi:protein-tyrosine phosphatase
VEGGKLLSPREGYPLALPRDGALDGAFFIPRAEDMFWMTVNAEKWYDFAITYGTVHGPFAYDPDMPLVGSMQSTKYQALTILTDSSADIQSSYDIPVLRGLTKSSLLAVEKQHQPLHITFICTGNICRSPMAEKMFAQQIRERGLADAVRVTSAGTDAWQLNWGADARTNHVLNANGYPTEHSVAKVNADHLSADLVVAMGRDHAQELRALGVPPGRVRLLRSFDPRSGANAPDVDDPFHGKLSRFKATFADIDAALPGLHSWVDDALANRGRQPDAARKPAHMASANLGRRSAAHLDRPGRVVDALPIGPPRSTQREESSMPTKKQAAARSKFAKQAKAKGATKVGRRAKASTNYKKKR